jgi:ABC-type branched-subunit amino acid transport system ATPase component
MSAGAGPTPAHAVASTLELRGVSAGYGRSVMLRDVDLDVPAGSVVAPLGPNGASKTALLRVAAGLLRASPCATASAYRSLPGHGTPVTSLRTDLQATASMCACTRSSRVTV